MCWIVLDRVASSFRVTAQTHSFEWTCREQHRAVWRRGYLIQAVWTDNFSRRVRLRTTLQTVRQTMLRTSVRLREASRVNTSPQKWAKERQ